MERDEGKKMDYITLFTDILPKEQERMRVCFHAREMTFRNGETIMEFPPEVMRQQIAKEKSI